jgi:hypothetical protein
MAPKNGQANTTGSNVVLLIVGLLAVGAFYGWASGGWERGYERERKEADERNAEIGRSLERAFQMPHEDYKRARRDAYRDAPVGQTRSGDTY